MSRRKEIEGILRDEAILAARETKLAVAREARKMRRHERALTRQQEHAILEFGWGFQQS